MEFSKALATGFQQSRSQFRLVLALYGINLLLAIPLAMGFRSALSAAFGDSMAMEVILEDFDATVYADFMKHHGQRISSFVSQVSWLALLAMVINVISTGGILSHLNETQPFSISRFLENCGKYFYRFLRLFIVFGLVMTLVAVVWFVIVAMVFFIVTSGASSERTLVFWFIPVCAIFLLPLMLFIIAGDYAKIRTVITDEVKMWKTFWRSVAFVFRNFFSVVSLQVSVLAALAIAVVLYWVIEGQIGMTSGVTIAGMFLIQQLSVGFKVWTRLWTFASEIQLYKHVGVVREEARIPLPAVPAAPAPAPEIPATEFAPRVKPVPRRRRRPLRTKVAARKPRRRSRR